MAVRFRPQPEKWLGVIILTLLLLVSFASLADEEYNQTILDGDFTSLSNSSQQISVEQGHSSIARYSQFGSTPLINAVLNKDYSTAISILENGADPNDADDAGVTALHFSAIHDMNNLISALLSRNAEINKTTINNLTPLMYAASFGNHNIVKNLLDHGADVNIKSIEGKTAIDYAIQSGSVMSVKYIAQEINEMPKSLLDQTMQYAKKSSKSEQMLSIINDAIIPPSSPASNQEVVNTNKVLNINTSKKNNHIQTAELQNLKKKGGEKKERKYTHHNQKNKEYYTLYFGAFTKVEDAVSYWNIIKSKHKWLSQLSYKIEKEQFYVNKQTFYDLFVGAFSNEKDAQDIQKILVYRNISVTVLPSKNNQNDMKIADVKKIKNSIAREIAIQQEKSKLNDKKETVKKIASVEKAINDTETIIKNGTERYVLDFGIFINNIHAEKYWQNISQIQWLSMLHPAYDTTIHNNIDKSVVSLKAGFMVDKELAENMADILTSVGIRVRALSLDYTPKGMSLVSKNNLFNKFHYSSYYPDNIKQQKDSQNKLLKIEVREAIPFEDNGNSDISSFNKATVNIKISSYKNRYIAALAIAKAGKYFKIDQHAVTISPSKRAIAYLTINNTNVNAACNYFIEQGYNCIDLETNND
ncbi:ankyrin repeat domain-containing protein [Candidatus Xenohaliotis californiensis]